jgi:NAD(P)-dependent dehydrogenase (short-subunit alcohol dehydrogenase family)
VSRPRGRSRGRRAFVSGGTSDLGMAIAQRFLSDGYEVTISGRDQNRLQAATLELARESGRDVRMQVCDVTDLDSVAEAMNAEDRIDVLVLNAGVAMSAPLPRTSRKDWDECFAVNVTGPFFMLQIAIPIMLEEGWGRIVGIGSTGSVFGARYTAAYSASKHALLGLLRVAATELMGTGVTANLVCPSFVDTAMTKRTIESIAHATGRDLKGSEAALLDSLPLGRLLNPKEVAAAVSYLASPSADAVNGQTLIIDGGALQR